MYSYSSHATSVPDAVPGGASGNIGDDINLQDLLKFITCYSLNWACFVEICPHSSSLNPYFIILVYLGREITRKRLQHTLCQTNVPKLMTSN